MKAIETSYKNHLFRSRLEARWAVYFDNLSVKWIYEPEGYELSDGSRYLPDFYLPDHGIYAEVKPEFLVDPRWRFFIDGINKPLIILDGLPEIREYRLYQPGEGPITKEQYWQAFLLPQGYEFFPWFNGSVDQYYINDELITTAITKACSARFENYTS